MEKEILEKLIESGLSQREIAFKLECSQSNIKYWLRKHGLKTTCKKYNKKIRENKYCPKCKKIKSINEFYKRTNRDSWGGYCKECSNNYHTERVRDVKIKMINYKGGQCVDCGLKLCDSHYSVFDFHHIDSTTKDPNFSKIKYQNWNKIKEEIEKCELLCSNCHRIKHALINKWGDSVTG
jgi:predicted transcriptional regulator